LREARVRDKVFRREEEQEKLRKSDEKELKKAAALYKKKQQQAARELRESAAEARKKDAEAKAREREAARVQKQQEKDAATTRKSAGLLKRALQQPHKASAKNLFVVVVQWVVQVEVQLHRRPRLLPRAQQHGDAASTFQQNLDSTDCAHASIYYTTNFSRDNSYCMWLRSLIFVIV
jgi:hypothetical protein